MDNVHVGVQLRHDPEQPVAQLVRADTASPVWEVDVNVVRSGARLDFRGPAVHGKRGDRFIYLSWVNIGHDNAFEMFRRAKLMLDRVEPHLMEAAIEAGTLGAEVNLTGGDGGPRCARVDPPAVRWSVPEV